MFMSRRSACLLLAAAVSHAAPYAAQPAVRKAAIVTFEARVLAVQNVERRALNLTEFAWDEQLVAAALAYAAKLAATGRWQHSPPEDRVGQGENLWMGTRSAYQFEEMVDEWVVEKRAFRAGRFPNVSKTGNLADVGHYTQLIWPATVRVGCAIRSSAEWDYLVCRYSEPGNVHGEPVGEQQLASR